MNFSDPLGLNPCAVCKWFEGVLKSYLAWRSKQVAEVNAEFAKMDKGFGFKPGTTRMLFGLAAGATGGLEDLGAEEGAAAAESGGPKHSPNWRPPTNEPQMPPTQIPEGWKVRTMGPTADYPNGYWRLLKPMANGSWQGIDPSTMKPGTEWETHVEFPPGSGGE